MLPVTFETKKEKPDSVAMIVVLDKSGSMGGQKIEMTKEAAKAPLALLKDTDSFGVVAFDYNFYWPVKFQLASNRTAITQAISTIIAGGETNIYPALREAYIQLAGSTNQVKHVILLSDGRSLPDDFDGRVASRLVPCRWHYVSVINAAVEFCQSNLSGLPQVFSARPVKDCLLAVQEIVLHVRAYVF